MTFNRFVRIIWVNEVCKNCKGNRKQKDLKVLKKIINTQIKTYFLVIYWMHMSFEEL